ncbi:MAG: IclR family transcriptional regulator [Herminiimonas sp.]|nr:IclR family transcriptional regulator [Herminiimonas sp.]MDB5852413.1 IclR family transcriptional regulator [Herminiimonas sp.]
MRSAFPYNGQRVNRSFTISYLPLPTSRPPITPPVRDDIGTIRRANLLLRLLATAGKRGLALTEISARSALPHPTVHRLLKQLNNEGLISQHEESRRYLLGPVAYELGLAAAEIFDLRHVCRPVLEKLSGETEDTSYFVMRSGFDAVCIDRIEGSFPIRTITLEIGSRRPLGVGAGGLAILAACSDEEHERILQATAPRLPDFGKLDVQQQREAIAGTRSAGYALVKNRVTLGVTALGMPFHDSMRRPIGAISVGAIDSRMGAQRRRQIAQLLKEQIVRIEKAIRDLSPAFIER